MLDLVIWTLITAVSLFVLDFALALWRALKAGATGAPWLDSSGHRARSATGPEPNIHVMSRKAAIPSSHEVGSRSAPCPIVRAGALYSSVQRLGVARNHGVTQRHS